jgi:hypothetical protein
MGVVEEEEVVHVLGEMRSTPSGVPHEAPCEAGEG